MIEGDVVGLDQHEWRENFGYFGQVLGAGGRAGEMATKCLLSEPEHDVAARSRTHAARTRFTSTET
jgi:hypothetical protein